ncbi:hypothetical protein [Natrinema salifodinae]|uniref:hypothetical protein n=1 Tax=Natrinema salifodinae TaxID=1202768 RepID=UPI000A633541|nr:hypothetical protein [Natrinema salifodinae]
MIRAVDRTLVLILVGQARASDRPSRLVPRSTRTEERVPVDGERVDADRRN